jgi:hypothetical protein
LVGKTGVNEQNDYEASRSRQRGDDGQHGVIEKPQLKDAQVRKAGAFMIVLSVAASKFFILDKLDQIRATHEAAIQFSTKMIMIAPVLFTLGLALCIGGYKVLSVIKGSREIGKKRYLFLLLLLIPAFVTQFWFESELSKIGYRDIR